MPQLTREAREGLTRAWLNLLKQRHPDMTWIAEDGTARLETEPLPDQEGDLIRRLNI